MLKNCDTTPIKESCMSSVVWGQTCSTKEVRVGEDLDGRNLDGRAAAKTLARRQEGGIVYSNATTTPVLPPNGSN